MRTIKIRMRGAIVVRPSAVFRALAQMQSGDALAKIRKITSATIIRGARPAISRRAPGTTPEKPPETLPGRHSAAVISSTSSTSRQKYKVRAV